MWEEQRGNVNWNAVVYLFIQQAAYVCLCTFSMRKVAQTTDLNNYISTRQVHFRFTYCLLAAGRIILY